MSRAARVLLAGFVIILALTGCKDPETTIEERGEMARTCQESGGRYVFDKPEGYISAYYHCVWDEVADAH